LIHGNYFELKKKEEKNYLLSCWGEYEGEEGKGGRGGRKGKGGREGKEEGGGCDGIFGRGGKSGVGEVLISKEWKIIDGGRIVGGKVT
jgi:hypothetical protein